MTLGNPHHNPVAEKIATEWHKVAALLMDATGLTQFEITEPMVKDFAAKNRTIVADCRGGKFVIRFMDDAQVAELMRREGEGN